MYKIFQEPDSPCQCGCFDKSLEMCIKNFKFISLKNIGLLPLGVIKDGKKYILIQEKHTGVCNNSACEDEAIDRISKDKEDYWLNKYENAPLYTNFGDHELCAMCVGIHKNKTFEPSDEEHDKVYSEFHEDYVKIPSKNMKEEVSQCIIL